MPGQLFLDKIVKGLDKTFKSCYLVVVTNLEKVFDKLEIPTLLRLCKICGSKYGLQFHHRDVNLKKNEKHSPVSNLSKTEAAKCDILCVQCHKRVHVVVRGSRPKYLRSHSEKLIEYIKEVYPEIMTKNKNSKWKKSNIKMRMLLMDINMSQLAEAIKKDLSYVSKILKGDSCPADIAKKIASALEVEVEDIFDFLRKKEWYRVKGAKRG